MRGLRKIARDERGQAVTEFAVVLPLLAVLLFGIIQGGITLSHYLTLTDAVRAGARAATVSADQSVGTQAMEDAAGGLQLTNPQVVPATLNGQQVVIAQAQVPYSITILGVTVASGYLTSKTIQRVE
jgi:Flp pilus assembly protein TadG